MWKSSLSLFFPLKLWLSHSLGCYLTLAPSDCPQGIQAWPYPKHTTGVSLFSPCSLVADASLWATSPLGVVFRHVFWSPPPFRLCCPLRFQTPHTPAIERVSWCLETSPPSQLPCQDGSPSLTLLCFVLPPFEESGLPFWVPSVLRQGSEVVLWKLLSI